MNKPSQPPQNSVTDSRSVLNTSLTSNSGDYASHAKGKTGIRRIINAAGYSLDGFKAAYCHEAAFRQVLWLNSALLVLLLFCSFSLPISMILVFASVFSLVVELFNTGIEAAIDHTSTERHPLAKVAKDVGSAAQFLALALLAVLWLLALLA